MELWTLFIRKFLKHLNKVKRLPYRGFHRDRFQVVSRGGITYLLNYKNSIDRQMLVDGGYEIAQLEILTSLIRKHACTEFYDVGANIGLYSLTVSKIPSITVIQAFEPVPSNISQLNTNIWLNKKEDYIKVHAYGLSDEENEVSFLENTGNSTGRSRIKSTNVNILNANQFIDTTIKVFRLDALNATKGKNIAIKIDAEGHETQIINGMIDFLKNNRCVLQIETYSPDKLTALMRSKGYILLEAIDTDHYYSNILK